MEEHFVEHDAVDCVNQIIKNETALLVMFIPETAELLPICKKVIITQKIKEGSWKAVAYLSNGGKRNCTVYYDENREVCVTVDE